MKTATMTEFLREARQVFSGEESVLVTRRGRPVGVVQPLPRPSKLPLEARRKLYAKSSARLTKKLRGRGITEEQVDHAIQALFGKNLRRR